jgi:two-component system response regulator PilR (NtrC family)
VAISCPAIPEPLIESELFGHLRGSFTGAVSDKKGLFEGANRGTLLLDEIAETPPAIQAKLLRALQEREIRRVGATTPVKVDVRVLAATNRDLKQLVESGAFREDLFYRLNVVSLAIPPLRERKEDIPLLIEHFLKQFGTGYTRKTLSPEALQLLTDYAWPGNVRELGNLVERLVILTPGDLIGPEDLPPAFRFSFLPPREAGGPASPAGAEGAYRYALPAEGIDLEAVKQQFILQAMEAAGGVIGKAAELLGLSYRTFYYRLMRASAAQADTGRARTG